MVKRAQIEDTGLPYVDPREITRASVFEAMGYDPDPWQQVFHEAPQRHRTLACGVRVGKTFAAGAEATYYAVRPSPISNPKVGWVGPRVWLLAPNYELGRFLFDIVLKNLRTHFRWAIADNGKAYSRRDMKIHLVGDGLVQGKSGENEDSIVGEQLDAVIADECARIPETVAMMAAQRLLTRRGYGVWISSPTSLKWFMRQFELGAGNGFHYEWTGQPIEGAKYAGRRVRFIPNDPVDNIDAKDYFSVRIPTHANERLSDEDLAREERIQPDRLFRQDFLAEFVGKTGLVFHDFEQLLLPKSTMIRQGVPGRPYVMGWDIARTNDFSAASVWDHIARQEVFIDRFQGDYEMQYARVVDIARRFGRPWIVADATGKGDAVVARLDVLNREASRARTLNPQHPGAFARRIEPVETYSNVEKRILVESLVTEVDAGTVRFIDLPEATNEMRLFEYVESETTKALKYGAPSGFKDDTVIARCLAYRAVGRPMGSAASFMA